MKNEFDVRHVPLSGAQLVEASAGTGKTYAISTLVVRLLVETGRSIDQILVVTFTEAATAELKQRVRARIRDALRALEGNKDRHGEGDQVLFHLLSRVDHGTARERLLAAVRDFDNAAIFTIHGFCHRALLENAFLSGVAFQAELLRDTRPLVEEVVADFWARDVAPSSRIVVERLRDEDIRPNSVQSLANWVASTPELPIVPNPLPSAPPLHPEKVRDAFLEAKRCFDEGEIRSALESAGLHGGKYRRDYIARWCRQMSEFFRQTREVPILPERFDKFCTPALLDASRNGAVPTHAFFTACDRLQAAIDETQAELEPHAIRFLARFVEFVQKETGHRKRRAGVLSFDDLLNDLWVALKGSEGHALRRNLQGRFPVALIDEFQDTDPVQYEIFERIYGGGQTPLFLIGDPKQAIYSFRGADVFAYFRARASVPENRRHTMVTNYRSDQRLVEAVNALFLAGPFPFFFDSLTYPKVDARAEAPLELDVPEALGRAPFQFRFLPRPKPESSKDGKRKSLRPGEQLSKRSVPEWVAREVAHLLAAKVPHRGRTLTPKDIAILTRTNAEAFECQRALQRYRVPSVVLGDRSVYEDKYPDARELQVFLAAVLEPGNARSVRTALTTEMLGVKAAELVRCEEDEEQWDRWMERFRAYNQKWASDGFVQMIRLALDEWQVPERLLALVDGERRMTNLLHLIELLHVEATTNHLGPSGLLQYLAEQRHRELSPQDSEQIRLESDEDSVTLTTVHKSKGLEYPVVLCPFLFADILIHPADAKTIKFHDPEANHRLTLDLGSSMKAQHKELMTNEALAENLRLLYVALTRARHRCIVYWGGAFRYESSALGYLLHSKDVRSIDGTPNREQVAGHLKGLPDTALWARLEELAHTVPGIGALSVDAIPEGPLYVSDSKRTNAPLCCREVAKPIGNWQRTTSFSNLVSRGSDSILEAAEGRDRDELSRGVNEARSSGQRIPLADFPRGAGAGNFFHSVLEVCDFQAPVPDALVRERLLVYGFSELEWVPRVQSALEELFVTPLRGALALNQVSRAERWNELEFFLPTRAHTTYDAGSPSAGSSYAEALDRVRLTRAFRDHPSDELTADYAARLSTLRFLPVEGFLKGFIDLVFRHDGVWYLVDYKTNWLGESFDDYSNERLLPVMAEHHYYLQYHLYVTALHRYLAHRLVEYDYEQHFGGVLYLFLRGMSKEHGSRSGVFFEKPPKERIAALSSLFSSPLGSSTGTFSEGASR